jgi:hypothetical protein
MTDYQKVIVTFTDPGTEHITKKYLDKYWLDKAEYENKWKPIQEKIFNMRAKYLPEMIFNNEFELLALVGGGIFALEDFIWLKECIKQTGDKYFVIIENANMSPSIYYGKGDYRTHPLLYFRFPVNVDWDDIMSGGSISRELFETSYKEFYVFGDSGKWGKYVANEYWDRSIDRAGTPLDIIGFTKEYEHVFRNTFKISKKDAATIKKWLPPKYREKCLK